MIYRALVDLAEQEGLLTETAYEPKEVHYLVHLSPGGGYLGYRAPRDEAPSDAKGRQQGKPRVPKRPIPRRSERTAQDHAEFLVDKAEYVFGIDPTEKRSEDKLAKRRQLFLERVRDAAQAVPSSTGLQALCGFLDNNVPAKLRQLLSPEKEAERKQVAAALFAFVYEPDGGVRCIHDEPEVKRYFMEVLSAEEGDLRGQCLVTGRTDVVLTRLHAQPKGIPPLSKTKGGVPLTTVNADAFKSYGLEDRGGAPISRRASIAIELALNRLLDPAYPRPDGGTFPQRRQIISPDTVVVYWSKGDAVLDFVAEIERADPEDVGQLLRAPYKGHVAPLEDPSAFYALILSGALGRGIVRSFVQSTVKDIATNIDRYRHEARIVRPYGESPGGYGLHEIRRTLVPRGDLEFLSPALGTDLYLAVLRNLPFPQSLLQTIIRRNRVDLLPSSRSGRPDERALAARTSLLKAYMNRNGRESLAVALDDTRTDSPYRLGRLLAILDKLQHDALGSLNATVVDRYYGSASSTPEAVFPTLLRRAQHHLAKLRRERPGLAVVTDRLMQNVMSDIRAFPKTLNLEHQALFALGFYHQRQDLFTKKTETANV
jgi:CRISPR-associated protein Csd1